MWRYFACIFLFSLIVCMSARTKSSVLFVCGSAVSVCSAAVLQKCVEQSCVGACRSYFRLSCDDAAAAF